MQVLLTVETDTEEEEEEETEEDPKQLHSPRHVLFSGGALRPSWVMV